MQSIFDILELDKYIVESIVDVVESDDKSKTSIKLKQLVKFI